ncbi:MAG: hypothetical protein H7Y11_00965 [Armatimonadetes bacterium]|nr:hypothetical protein [Anaerolineae bacterium]
MALPAYPAALRWLMILCGIAIFIWLSPEDNSVLPVVLLSAVVTAVSMTHGVLRRWGGQTIAARYSWVLLPLWGAVLGGGTSLLTAVLMVLKDARHAHLYPDYPLTLITGMLARAPIWAVAGALAAFGVRLVLLYKSPI